MQGKANVHNDVSGTSWYIDWCHTSTNNVGTWHLWWQLIIIHTQLASSYCLSTPARWWALVCHSILKNNAHQLAINGCMLQPTATYQANKIHHTIYHTTATDFTSHRGQYSTRHCTDIQDLTQRMYVSSALLYQDRLQMYTALLHMSTASCCTHQQLITIRIARISC